MRILLFFGAGVGSCRFGENNKGTCWDEYDDNQVNGTTCRSRYCKSGWTCSCLGRTHLCPLRNITTMVVDQFLPNSNLSRATCYTRTLESASKPSIELGGWNMSLSRTGVLQNKCLQLRWYHNGEEMASFDKTPVVSADNLDAEVNRRAVNSLYEFKPGDLLAFQWTAASYFCHLSQFAINVDGNVRLVTNANSSDTIRFARRFSTDWYQPWFIPVLGENEYTAEAWHFVPLRQKLFNGGAPITPGIDYWRADDGSRDHETTNFYYRVLL